MAREVGFMRVLTREFKGVYDATRYNLKKMILALPPQTVIEAYHLIHIPLKSKALNDLTIPYVGLETSTRRIKRDRVDKEEP